MKSKSLINLVISVLVLFVVLYEGVWKWGVCRIYVKEGYSLLVMYRGNLLFFWPSPPKAQGDFAKVDAKGRPLEVGILKEMVGPGRHFNYDPLHYTVELVPDIVIEPGSVAVVKSNLGKDLPDGQFLVEGDVGATEYKGVLRKVLKPGRYRINKYGYEHRIITPAAPTPTLASQPTLAQRPASTQAGGNRQQPRPEAVRRPTKPLGEQSGWVYIPAGYVGVVTYLAPDPSRNLQPGIQEDVLQPGFYAINPSEQRVDVVEIGYREISIKADLTRDRNNHIALDENGEPYLQTAGNPGINFPSNDGFPISLDFTAIWGIMPDQAPKVIRGFKNIDDVEQTVIVPQIESICRNRGSELGAVDLLTGSTREKFQIGVSDDFRKVLAEKNLSLQVGLVRHIYIPAAVRGPIQKANIADEIKLTRDMEIQTAKVEANLEQARSSVDKEEKGVIAETEKLYQEAMAIGNKKVEEIRAETGRLVATIARQTAGVLAQAKLVEGEADATVKKLTSEAKAQKFALAVQAFGSPDAYNQWIFASSLPADVKINFLYAGPGTFWTDLKSFQDAAAGKIMQTQGGK